MELMRGYFDDMIFSHIRQAPDTDGHRRTLMDTDDRFSNVEQHGWIEPTQKTNLFKRVIVKSLSKILRHNTIILISLTAEDVVHEAYFNRKFLSDA